jgi:hypothetical protein
MVEGKLVTRPGLHRHYRQFALSFSGNQDGGFAITLYYEHKCPGLPNWWPTGSRHQVTDSDKESTDWRVVQ